MSKKKDKTGEAPAEGGAQTISIAAHPRARGSIRRTRARTALAAFAIVLFLSLNASVPDQEAVLRALIAGFAGHLAGWACALAVWRQLVLAELKVIENARRAQQQARLEAARSESDRKSGAAQAAPVS